MILLPDTPAPNSAVLSMLDFGGVMRPPTGAKILRLNRQGNRYKMTGTLPPLPADPNGRVFVSRLIAAKRQGIRMEIPLLGVNQGAPGSPLVNGAGQSGLTINLKGLTPAYVVREGYWMSIVDAAGQHYVHNVRADVVADSGGLAAVQIEPMLRVPFANNAVVHLAAPMIEGLVDGDEMAWQLSLGNFVELSFSVEEAA